jgi:hypothetical protein
VICGLALLAVSGWSIATGSGGIDGVAGGTGFVVLGVWIIRTARRQTDIAKPSY